LGKCVLKVEGINAEDALVPLAVKEKTPQIGKLVLAIVERRKKRVFYSWYLLEA